MSYKTILVCLTDMHSGESLAGFAAAIAARFDAHLIGVHVSRQIELHSGIAPYISEAMLEELQRNITEEAAAFKALFETATADRSGVAEWRDIEARSGSTVQTLIEHALAADLIVMAQPDEGHDLGDRSALHRRLLLGAGRPILVLPRSGRFPTVGSKVLLCWNGTKEASRAAHDALPFLTAADEVVVFGVTDKGGRGADLSGHELAAGLARHGIRTEVTNYTRGNLSVADEILNAVSDTGSNLVVMGAYGHSRVYDFVLGAATHRVLSHMTAPVLFAS